MRFAEKLGRLLFPAKCMFCRRVIDSGWVCAQCRDRLPENRRAPFKGEFFSKCVSPLRYTGDVRRAVLRMKFGGKRNYAAGFAQMLAETVDRELAGQFDVITWVPLSRRRLRRRGYDQARLIAEHTGRHFGMEAAALLEKTVDNRPQSGISGAAQRRANVSGAYRVTDPGLVRGRRVLLIDDVVTTGATLSECARELLLAGAEKVVCGTAAFAARR